MGRTKETGGRSTAGIRRGGAVRIIRNPADLTPDAWAREEDLNEWGGVAVEVSQVHLSNIVIGRSRGDYRVPLFAIPHAGGSDYSGGTVARANYDVIDAMAADDDSLAPYLVMAHGNHGSYQAYIRLDVGPVPDDLLRVVSALSDYPVLDEEALGSLEAEREDEAWEDWGRADFRKALADAFADEDIEDLADEAVDMLWNHAGQKLGWNSNHTVEGVVFNFSGAVKVTDWDDIEAAQALPVRNPAMSASARHSLRSSDFAVPEREGLPINDATHVRAAMSRFGQFDWESQGQRQRAFTRIVSRARRLGVGYDGFVRRWRGR